MFVLCYNAAERQSITGNDDVEYSGVGLFIPLEVFEMPKGNPEGSSEENLEKNLDEFLMYLGVILDRIPKDIPNRTTEAIIEGIPGEISGGIMERFLYS